MRKYLKEGQYSIDEADLLGKGSFGKVFRGYDHTNSRWVAIKMINLEVIQFHGPEMKTIVCNEITVMRKFTTKMNQKPCPYLVKQYDCFRTQTNVNIVMQLCQGGTLHDAITAKTLKEQEVKNIIKQILSGLVYLQQLNICHRDLKPDNIFISSQFENGQNQVIYKIGDFGFASQKHSFSEVLGTYPYMAPQIFYKQNYTYKVDVWSLGIITYQLLFQKLYFMGKNKWQIQKQVKEVPFQFLIGQTQKISSQMKDFITICLKKGQQDRPKASQLLQNPLFEIDQSIIFQAIEHQLMLCELLRSMAEQICQFGISLNRNTQFIQIYLLKKSFASINIVTYSISNQQNYLNISSQFFNILLKQKYKKEFNQLLEKVEKQNILITSVFQDKYKEFSKFIQKFNENQVKAINNVIRSQEIYSDLNRQVFKAELKKWIQTLNSEPEYEQLQLKCKKLMELS